MADTKTKILGNIGSIKQFMERVGAISPNGGKTVGLAEMKALSSEDKEELGALAKAELGL